MSEACEREDCGGCGVAGCSQRKAGITKLEANERSEIGKVIAVISGKGGVGKSSVTALLANYLREKGKKVAILDADITGPSIPGMYGITDKADAEDGFVVPAVSAQGIRIMSINLLLEDEKAPVVWRGPIISGTVRQFWTEVAWGQTDVMLVDLPPGTGDVPLTVFQYFPVDGIVVVSSPQDIVSMIVGKAVRMAQMMNVPIMGLVENMSWYECPDCGRRLELFGESKAEKVAGEFGIDCVAKLPVRPEQAALFDAGKGDQARQEGLAPVAEKILGI